MESMFKRYADDYELVITTDKNGNETKVAEYRGKYFELPLDGAGLQRYKRNSIGLFIMVAALHVGAGFLTNLGMYQFYIAMPYVLAYFALLYVAMGAFRLPQEKRLFRRDEIGLSFGRMKSAGMLLAALLAISVIGEGVFFFLMPGEASKLPEVIYFLIELLATLLSILSILYQRTIKVNPHSENETA
jgi:hypothetical protein